MNFEVNVGIETRKQIALIDTEGDLHFIRNDGSTTCITKDGYVVDYSPEEFELDISTAVPLFEGDSVILHL